MLKKKNYSSFFITCNHYISNIVSHCHCLPSSSWMKALEIATSAPSPVIYKVRFIYLFILSDPLVFRTFLYWRLRLFLQSRSWSCFQFSLSIYTVCYTVTLYMSSYVTSVLKNIWRLSVFQQQEYKVWSLTVVFHTLPFDYFLSLTP